jgi:putative ABC transport system permease protein
MALFTRFANLFRAGRLARDIEREHEFHIAERTDELVARGLTPDAARRAAQLEFGHRTVMKERTRDTDVLSWVESLLADLRYAVRSLAGSPGFAAVAILSLALGIGANTAIFSLINAVMLRPLPVAAPEQLVRVTMNEDADTFTNPLWEQIRDHQQVVDAVAFGAEDVDLARGGPARRVQGHFVSGGYFATLGVRPAAGRLLTPRDDTPGCQPVAVVSDALGRREFGEPANAVGKTLTLDGHVFQVVGVADGRFTGLDVGAPAQVFAPICTVPLVEGRPDVLQARSRWFLQIMARLPAGVTAADASARLGAVAPALFRATLPDDWPAQDQQWYLDRTLVAVEAATGFSGLRQSYTGALYALLVVVGVVLLIACANVAHLLLARADARRREMAVRIALGAGRARLVRQLLTESVVLALLGAGLGALFARWSSSVLVRLLGTRSNTVWLDVSLDLRVLGFTMAVAVVTGVLFGLAPAWRASNVEPHAAMKAQGRGATTRGRATTIIVTAQVALSLVLLVAAGLLLRSFRKLITLDPGFRRDGVLVVTLDPTPLGYDSASQKAFHRDMLERIRALPGVRSAATARITPIAGMRWNNKVGADGFTPRDERDGIVWFNGVSSDYFATLGTPLLAGRDFTAQDAGGAPRVAIVNQSLARKLFGDANPVGKSLWTMRGDVRERAMRVVAVVADAKYGSLRETESATAFFPVEQANWWGAALNYVIRTDGPPLAVSSLVTRAVAAVNGAITLDIRSLEEQVNNSLTRPRLLATLSGFFGALALLLAMIGLYGTVAYGVVRRRSEIGIRIALGAARTRVLRMILGEVSRVLVAGVIAGTLLAIAVTRLLETFLFGLTATDPPTLGLSALALAAVALLAGAIPALRAARLDPMVVLRED